VRQLTHRKRPVSRLGVFIVGTSLLFAAACTKASTSPSGGASSTSAADPSSPAGSAPASSGIASSGDPAASAPASVSASASTPLAGGPDPLTGAPAGSAAAGTRPALAAKIDNVDGAWPQAGLNQADIVFDIPVEGGLTRLLAIFHSQDVSLFGPIRSGRPVDADLLHLLGHAYYAFSGGTPFDLGPISDHSNATALSWSIYPDLFVIRNDHRIPHQVFGTTSMLYAGGQQFSPSTTPPTAIFSYAAATPAGGVPSTGVTAQYDAATAAWTWNGSQYLRNQSGHADILIDGSQVAATNVVVMSVAVQSTAARDSHGTVVPLPIVIGSGQAWVFRNGVLVKGKWSRASENAPMTLQTTTGQVIPLAPGRTWVEVLPNSRAPLVH
jgi:hypothetical protein